MALDNLVEEHVSIKYLARFLQGRGLQDVITGSTQPQITQENLRKVVIGLPPFAEQTRIAQKLDELLAQVDTLKARLQAIPALLKRFRQSTLAAAASGRLSADWRGQHFDFIGKINPATAGGVNANLVLHGQAKRHAYDTADNQKQAPLEPLLEVPSSWTLPIIKAIGRVQLGRQRSPKYHSGANMRPYLRVQNVFEDRLDLTDVMEMDFPASDFEKYKLKVGDILLNEGQSPQYLGRPAMFHGELDDVCFTNTLIRFQAHPVVIAQYALFVFRHYMHAGHFSLQGTITTNIAHLGAGRFADMSFPLPPLEEQTEIVRRVEQLFAFADQLEAKVASAKSRIDHLTQSILAKAFRGELVPQDPNDEPASMLLERIQAQRAAAPKAKRGRKASA